MQGKIIVGDAVPNSVEFVNSDLTNLVDQVESVFSLVLNVS